MRRTKGGHEVTLDEPYEILALSAGIAAAGERLDPSIADVAYAFLPDLQIATAALRQTRFGATPGARELPIAEVVLTEGIQFDTALNAWEMLVIRAKESHRGIRVARTALGLGRALTAHYELTRPYAGK